MPQPAPLLLAYDAECPLCRRLVDWVQRRDRWGLIIPFPLQNPELVRMAPELAGRPLQEALHGLDTGTRQVRAGGDLLPWVARRLPWWRFWAPILRLPGLARLLSGCYRFLSTRRYRPIGRRPFER